MGLRAGQGGGGVQHITHNILLENWAITFKISRSQEEKGNYSQVTQKNFFTDCNIRGLTSR